MDKIARTPHNTRVDEPALLTTQPEYHSEQSVDDDDGANCVSVAEQRQSVGVVADGVDGTIRHLFLLVAACIPPSGRIASAHSWWHLGVLLSHSV